ncbi:hypothetical protein UFOVP1254_103 [uncultured Caudovirales phage]|uniref:HK97 gp10 family phage protein n=1 Tax=uncultured Caudovirales phage TaxID=2100421 RepID=A0A6J5RQB3_9CAUD|nr:hypothetical protein UFOVP1254_103 [uncultured Caudovirales phage]
MSEKNRRVLAQLSGHIEGITRSMNEVAYNVISLMIMRLNEVSPVGDPATWKGKNGKPRKPPPGYVGGQFRGNWQLGVDMKPAGWFQGKIDPTGDATVAENIARIPNHASRHNYYIINAVPYAWRIEEGWSKRAPRPMVGRVRREFPMMLQSVVNDIKARGGRVR